MDKSSGLAWASLVPPMSKLLVLCLLIWTQLAGHSNSTMNDRLVNSLNPDLDNSEVPFLVLMFSDSSTPVDDQDSISVNYAKPNPADTCCDYKIFIRKVDSNEQQVFNVLSDAGTYTFARLTPGSKYEIIPSTTIKNGSEYNGTTVQRYTDVAQVTDFRIEPTLATTFNLTFTFQRPNGNFSKLLLCYRNTETRKALTEPKKCNIPIPSSQSPFSYLFNYSSSQLEYGNSYEFSIKTEGCEENSISLCEADSITRPFEMGPDGISLNSSLDLLVQTDSIMATFKSPAPIFDNVTYLCESVDRKKNSLSTGLCKEKHDGETKLISCSCSKLLPAELYNMTLTVNRRLKRSVFRYPGSIWTKIERPQALMVQEEFSRDTSLRVCWKYQYDEDKNLDGFIIKTAQLNDDGSTTTRPELSCSVHVVNSPPCEQEFFDPNYRRICFNGTNLLPGTRYQFDVVSFYKPDNADQIEDSRVVLAKTNLDLPSNVRVESENAKSLVITFVPPKSPRSNTSFELCIYERDKNRYISCQVLQYPSPGVAKKINSIPTLNQEVSMKVELNQTAANTEYTLKFAVSKSGFNDVNGEYCSYTHQGICIAYKIPIPSRDNTVSPLLYTVIILSVLVPVLLSAALLGYRKWKKENEGRVKPSKIGKILRERFDPHKDSTTDVSTLAKEWNILKDIQNKNGRELYWEQGSQFTKKNKFTDIIPYIGNRIKLDSPGVEGSYINASYIKGANENVSFIAAMGPNESTIEDFWKMIWQEDVDKIITLVREKPESDCAIYWPKKEGAFKVYGSIRVEARKIQSPSPYFIHRKFKLVQDGKYMIVNQYHFTKWTTEKDSRTEPEAFSEFVEYVISSKTANKLNGAWLVHCSGGAGRTGAFISIMRLYQNAVADKYVNVFKTVQHLRTQRPKMIQTPYQYRLVYQVLDLVYQRHHRSGEAQPVSRDRTASQRGANVYVIEMNEISMEESLEDEL